MKKYKQKKLKLTETMNNTNITIYIILQIKSIAN